MFYLGLENQMTFIIVLCFSFYFIVSSFTLKENISGVRDYGICFITPFTLSIVSFMLIFSNNSWQFLVYAELLLVFLLYLVSFINQKATTTLMFLSTIFPFVMIFLLLNIPIMSSISTIAILGFTLLALTLITLISNIFLKNTSIISLYLSLFFILSSVLISRLITFEGQGYIVILLKLLGYITITAYLNSISYKLYFEQHKEAKRTLDRIDQSLQREVVRRVQEIEKSNQKLLELAKTDNLTKAYTKKAIIDIMESLISKSPEKNFTVLMFDIDNFKKINDTYGHIAGDKCIKKLANIAMSTIRGDDRLGRYGGDEFIIVLPDTNLVKGHVVAERFRERVAETDSPSFTISVGISVYPIDGTTTKALINSADEALYISKEMGRNKVTYKRI